MSPEAESYYTKKLERLADKDLRIFSRPPVSGRPPLSTRIHLIGICGTAVGSLAGLLSEAGYQVSGSDEKAYPPMSDQIAHLGIQFYEGFKAENLIDKDLIIVGNVCGPENPEAAYARERNLPTLSSAEAYERFFINGKTNSLVVAGTHGKTTTTGLLAHLFQSATTNPTYLVGGVLKNTEKSYSYGDGPVVIVEGDEYDTAYFDKAPKFLHYRPTSAIITSLEFDHIDIYDDLKDYTQAFEFLVESIPEDGNLFLWGDDPNVRRLAEKAKCNVFFYGLKGNNQIEARNIIAGVNGEEFRLFVNGKELGMLKSPLSGEHNLLNVLAICGIALANGLSFEQVKAGLESFAGMKRRQDIVGEINGITVIDDFAHHPTAVRETISAIKEKFGKRRVVVFFEPRSNTSRRKLFEEEYGKAFDRSEKVFLSVPPLRHNDRAEDFINEEKVVEIINSRAGIAKASYFSNAEELLAAALPEIRSGDVILIMSNGSFAGIHLRLLRELQERPISV